MLCYIIVGYGEVVEYWAAFSFGGISMKKHQRIKIHRGKRFDAKGAFETDGKEQHSCVAG
ncbi:hypothetical protein D3C75_1099140 [compost metagenome]